MGSVLGAGAFTALGPAAQVAGWLLPVSLLVALLVSLANAYASAQIAARWPGSVGIYEASKQMLGPTGGYIAGWATLVGALAAMAALARIAGTHMWLAHYPVAATAVIVVATGFALRGFHRSAPVTAVVVTLVMVVLAVVLIVATRSPNIAPDSSIILRNLPLNSASGWARMGHGAALCFFLFSGCFLTTCQRQPVEKSSLPRSFTTALLVVGTFYGLLTYGLLTRLGPPIIGPSPTPVGDLADLAALRTSLENIGTIPPGVTAGGVGVTAGIAATAAIVALLGYSARLLAAMGNQRDLPPIIGQGARRPPWRGVLCAAGIALVLTLVMTTTAALEFCVFALLLAAGLQSLAAWRAWPGGKRAGKVVLAVSVLGNSLLLICLPLSVTLAGAVLLGAGLLIRTLVGPSSTDATARGAWPAPQPNTGRGGPQYPPEADISAAQ